MSDDLSKTEAVNARTKDLDRESTGDLVATLYREQRLAVAAIEETLPVIARAVDAIAQAVAAGGSLHYFGAGTSGRLAVLDAAECPPTFGTPPSLVQAHLAGGAAAFVASIEGAEDDAAAGAAQAQRAVGRGDAVIGISASGSARFAIAALERCNHIGALTVALTSDARSPLARVAAHAIVVMTGPEALAGSTRLGAGTVQKIVLSTISTALMVRLGHVYENLMVDVKPSNAKLRARAVGLVQQLAAVDEASAKQLLEAAEGSVKLAVVMHRLRLDLAAAREHLQRSRESLRVALSER